MSVLPSIPHIYSHGNNTHTTASTISTTAHRAAVAAGLPTCPIQQQQQQAPHPTTSTPSAPAVDGGNTIYLHGSRRGCVRAVDVQDDIDGVTWPME